VDQTPRARTVAGLVSLAALSALTVLSLWFISPPSPRAADAPPTEFSAARAFTHVERIGSAVHVAGSPAAAQVREYIQTTLSGLGLQPQIHEGVGADDALGGGFAMAHIHDVVATIPGTDSTGTVFAMAHYDSVQVSYGGNDDGVGVSTLLEAARALTTGPKPRNDIVLVFTDAEEACLCGAESFVNQNALAGKGGVVLNFEARGSSGPAIMFETSEGNADVVSVYGDAVPYPVATSFAVEVYRILPNDTDFTPFRKSGRFTGLNTAYIDGSPVYHSPEDKPSYMDKASLQHHGSNALAEMRAFGAADIASLSKPSAYDSTYFPLLGFLLQYPGWLVWPLAALGLLAVAVLAVLARRRGLTSVGKVVAGFGLGLIPLVLAPVLAQLLWVVLVAVRPGYREMIDPWRPGWYRGAVVALVAVVILTWYGLLRRRFGAWALTIGGLGWLAVLGLLLAAATPGGSYLAALPALFGGVAGIVALWAESGTTKADRRALSLRSLWARTAVLALGAAVAVLILAPTVLLFFPALGLALGGAAALFATMLGLALLPLLDVLYPSAESAGSRRRLRGALPGLAAGVIALACVATGLVVDQFDAVHPAPEQLMYVLDEDTGQANWVSGDSQPGSWNRQYLTGHIDLTESFPLLKKATLSGPATVANLPAPTLTVVSDSTSGARRTVTLNLKPQRAVRLVYLRVDDATVAAATVDGRTVPPDALKDRFGVLFHAPPADGLVVTLVLEKAGPVKVRVFDGSDGLDALPGFHPRPPGIGVEGSHDSELVAVGKTYTI
jgi:hypothetical protein